MQTTRYGVIGCGMMGREHLANIALLPHAEVAAIFEPDAQMAAEAAAMAPGARMMDSLEPLLDQPDLDCLLIASPNQHHIGQLETVLSRRPLPVLVEKPVFTDPADAQRVEKLIAEAPAPVWVAMEYRYMPPIAAFLKEALDATGGVKMLTIREHRYPFLPKVGHWNRFNANTGGTFVEKCCHFFDLMRLCLRSEPVRVMASGGQAVNHLGESYGGQVPDIFDHGYVIVDFASGARAMLELCMFAEGSRYQEEISAVGPDGKLEVMVPGPLRFWPDHLGPLPVPQLIRSPRSPMGPLDIAVPVDPELLAAGDHNGSTYYQHRHFLSLVRGERDVPEVSLRDGLMAVRMGQAAQLSMTTGQAVDL